MGLLFAEQWFDEPKYSEEGFVPYICEGVTYKLWYGKVGSGTKPPILILHGGPGGSHYNLVSFQALKDDRPVIFYDQLGCGNSDRPENDRLWTAERYFEEAHVLIKELNLESYHLGGHSWGTTIATAIAARHPEGMLSLSLNSPIVSFPRYIQEVAPILKSLLPDNAGKFIDDFELYGRGDEKKYEEALMEHVRQSVIRSWPLPAPMERLIAAKNPQIHKTMIGSASELNILGNLARIDVSEDLKSLSMPILLTCGESDLCTPDFTRWHHSLVPHAELKIINDSAHMTPIDNPAELMTVQSAFLLKNDHDK